MAIRRLTIHILVLLLLYQALRLGFYMGNLNQFRDVSVIQIATAFAWGFRFDLAAIILSNGLFYALTLIPWPQAFRTKIAVMLRVFATFVNFLCLGISVGDVEYYKFTGKRFTRDTLALLQDIGRQFFQLAAYYWYFSAAILLLAWLLYRLHRWVFVFAAENELNWPRRVATASFLLFGLAFGARGGWQPKPLIPAHAFTTGNPHLGILSLNSAFTFIKSGEKQNLEDLRLLSDEDMKNIIAAHAAEPTLVPFENPPRNVVIIILESFGLEYVSPPDGRASFTPFLAQLTKQGSFFPHAFANGRRSIDAVPAILASIPSWMTAPFITSPYQTNQILGLPRLLANHGISSTFYHGGNNGTMFFDVLAKNLGFQRYVGANEYPHAEDYDGQWGIFDEPFLQYVVKDIGKQKTPFFATIFTLSSHNPYRIPPQYAGRFAKGTLEIHESLGYADYALQKFFEKARQEDWYRDTLFVLTADHTSKSEAPLYETSYGRFSVPLVFLRGDQPLPFRDTKRLTQHIDIMPTILDSMRVSSTEKVPFGQSLLRDDKRAGIVLYDSNFYQLLGPESLISSDLKESTHIYNWRSDPLLLRPITPQSNFNSALNYLKAEIQFFHQGMIQNKLLLKIDQTESVVH